MEIKVGCDIVHIPKFKKSAEAGGRKFFEKIFTAYELAGTPSIETLAGIFAAKEAAIKALGIPVGSWHNIEISHHKNGKPKIKLLGNSVSKYKGEVSIAHDGEYALAFVVFYG